MTRGASACRLVLYDSLVRHVRNFADGNRRQRHAELLGLSGPRNPYPGTLGVVEEGAHADLLLVDGNPLEERRLVANPGESFLVIMKDGKIYKNARNRARSAHGGMPDGTSAFLCAPGLISPSL